MPFHAKCVRATEAGELQCTHPPWARNLPSTAMNSTRLSTSEPHSAKAWAADPHGAGRGSAFDQQAHSVAPVDTGSLGQFSARTLIVVGIVGLAAGAWLARDVLLLGFAGVLLGLALRAGADALVHRLQWSPRWALTATVVSVLTALGLAFWLIGDTVIDQANELARTLPRNIEQMRRWLEGTTLGSVALESLKSVDGDQSLTRAAGFAVNTVGALGGILLVLVVGIYVAADPQWYRNGVLRLAPMHLRPQLERGLRASAVALRRFLLGQAVAMVIVGILTGIGLWLLDLPMALVLALMAALLAFVPFYGPLVAVAPAIMLGFTVSPQTALYVTLLYFAVKQIEGSVISPQIQKRAVALPPALGPFSVAGFGFLFGPLGVILGAPLTVMLIALVRQWRAR